MSQYNDLNQAESYLDSLPGIPQASSDKCDILHLAFGGLGGHRAVIEELSSALRATSLVSEALLLAQRGGNQDWGKSRGLSHTDSIVLKRRADMSSMIAVGRAVRRLKPEVIVAHTHRHIPAAWLGSLFSGKWPRIVLVEHQSLELRTTSDNINSAIGILFSKAVVFLTPSYRDGYPLRRLLGLLRKTTSVIPNGIEIPNEIKTWTDVNRRYFVIGMASRLIPEKEISNLIQAIAILNQEGDFRLRIAGDGPDRAHLKALSQHLCMENRVQFDGEIDRSQMKDWFLSLDMYAQISSGETMSMSIVEAASFGLPIISSNNPGFRDVFQKEEDAVVLKSNTPEEIASSIMTVVTKSLLPALGIAAHSIVSQSFDNQIMAQRYLELMIKISSLTGKEIPRQNQFEV